LDLTASSSLLGKPALNDMKSGLATAPVGFRVYCSLIMYIC
jgi:geranylgeranyl pyrophosphate synthase